MELVENFFNKVLGELDAKYFPNVNYYRDNEDCANLHYQTELFNNGCLTYKVYINRVAKICKDTKDNILLIVDKFVIVK